MVDLRMRTIKAMEGLDLNALHECVKELDAQGCEYHEIEDMLQQGMSLVGEHFADGEYFLADLIVSGMMFKSALSLLRADTSAQRTGPTRGRVLIGVVAGDIHDIGKDIVSQVLKTEQFDILDLGVDVPAEAFVQAAQNYQPDIVALSGVMGASSHEMQLVIDAFAEAGIRTRVPIVVGGSCVSDLVKDQIKADCFARGPVDTMLFCKNVMERKKENGQNR